MHERLFQDIDRQGGFLPEQSRPKERMVFTGDVLTVSGLSGTGKTVAVHDLAEELGIDSIKIGGILRDEAKALRGKDFVGMFERDVTRDQQLDAITEAAIANAQATGRPVIIEGRLAGFVATRMIQRAIAEGRTPPKIATFYFGTDEETRLTRLFERHQVENPTLTREESDREQLQREQADLTQWQKAHPEWGKDFNPYDPNATDEHGNRIYTHYIDTTPKVQEVKRNILKQLEKTGFAEKRIETDKQLPPQGIVFQNP